MPTPAQVAELFASIAQLLELKGENPFKIRAYRAAERLFETFTGDLAAEIANDTLRSRPGVGDAIADKTAEFFRTGKLEFHDRLKAEFPPGLFALFDLSGLGPKKIKILHDQLAVDSLDSLAKALDAGSVAALPGFGEKTAANLRKALEQRQANAGLFRLGDAAHEAERIYEFLRSHPDVLQVSRAGSYRRRKEILHDLDFVVASSEPSFVADDFCSQPHIEEVLLRGPTKCSVRLPGGIPCDLRIVANSEFPFAVAYFTGSKEHNVELRRRARQKGWTLNEYRLAPENTPDEAVGPDTPPSPEKIAPIPLIRTETELYAAFGLPFIEPELRENLGEFAAAAAGRLPRLIEIQHLRGAFHCHTVASDGRNSLEEMALAAHDLGLEYLGIADHSKSQVQANGLSAQRLAAQIEEIDRLNPAFDGFRILKGVECDILRDGTLDFPDDVLAPLDYVVASVHNSSTLSEKEQTERIIRAMQNPHVTLIAHLTGRLLLHRPGYAVNIPEIFDAAVETGTWIELNANPWRLDLDWRWWHLAQEKGVKCVINPDAHSVAGLQDLWFGVAQARKGWLTRADVINCLPLAEILPLLTKKSKKK